MEILSVFPLRTAYRTVSDMEINSIIGQCLEFACSSGLPRHKQHDVAVKVIRKLRPEWSDSQIFDAINRVRTTAFGETVEA